MDASSLSAQLAFSFLVRSRTSSPGNGATRSGVDLSTMRQMCFLFLCRELNNGCISDTEGHKAS